MAKHLAKQRPVFDQKKLASIDANIVKDYPHVSSIIIVRNGYIVHEKYFKGDANTLREVWSQTKSVVSILIGVLISGGKIKNVDENLLALLPELQSKETTINSKKLVLKPLTHHDIRPSG